MKQRAASKAQKKAAKKRSAAKKNNATTGKGDADGNVEMGVVDEEVAVVEEGEPRTTGRQAHALKVQARRALKTKLTDLKAKRQKIAKKNVVSKPER